MHDARGDGPARRRARPTNSGFAARPTVREYRIRLRVASVDEFIDRYAGLNNDEHIFIFTRYAQPVGTRLRFWLCLVDGEPFLHAHGIVCRTQRDPCPGMDLSLTPLDDESQRIIDRMRAHCTPTLDLEPLTELIPEEDKVPANPLHGISDGAIEEFLQTTPTLSGR
jgi:hypothetical protein